MGRVRRHLPLRHSLLTLVRTTLPYNSQFMYNSLPISLLSQRYKCRYLAQCKTEPDQNITLNAKRLVMYPNDKTDIGPKSSRSPMSPCDTASSAPPQHQPATASCLTACLVRASRARPHWTWCSANRLSGGTGCTLDLRRSSLRRQREKSASWDPCNPLYRRLRSRSCPSCPDDLRELDG